MLKQVKISNELEKETQPDNSAVISIDTYHVAECDVTWEQQKKLNIKQNQIMK